ncbi:Zinc finger PHD-finger [Penicillium sp. DV-2018c]|nr:Zinc finger PHD-finger [Penicillium sp. DV-2018c]
MLRTPAVLVDTPYDTSSSLIRSIEDHDVHPRSSQIRWGSISSTQPILSGPEQIRVYHEWIDAGRPHNIVCWECRLPDSLIGCQTCCRSYHTACLLDVVRSANNFHCPSCRTRAWDRSPPQFPTPSPISSNRGITPSFHATPAFGNSPIHSERSPSDSGRRSSGTSRMLSTPALGRINEFNHRSTPAGPSPIAEMYPQLLEYLASADTGTYQHAQTSQFKHQLELAMKEIESNRSLLQEKANIREEYLRLQAENAQIKARLDSKDSPRESARPSPSMMPPSTSYPAEEQRGKAWDSLAIDLF